MDRKNLRAKKFVPLFNEAIDKTELTNSAKTALDVLNDWQFNDDASLPEPLIFDTWIRSIEQDLFKTIPEDVLTLFSGLGQTIDELLRMGDESIWITEQRSEERRVGNECEFM